MGETIIASKSKLGKRVGERRACQWEIIRGVKLGLGTERASAKTNLGKKRKLRKRSFGNKTKLRDES